ncbi:putative serine protease PepD [Lipingzhangella halophila]|uniref:Putative serine protease PepD n=1 Tax=Lipingzhangella halophila TaxID=1783352 RepID=A0A7W7W0G2_9ACTN|nr:trypsin-like peptidase domain-containing protein [Lipingzhangella halophila]MBB4929877.1 putative serine protease PepD [Lipingzhangella halophila]
MPLWAVLLTVLLVAVVSAGVGGLAGGFASGDSDAAASENGPELNNDVPSGTPSREPDTIAGVAQRVSPSVVAIHGADGGASGNGSGFVIENNRVVTNAHVVNALEGNHIEVAYSDGHTTAATVAGQADSSDLAVLELDNPNNVQALEFGNSEDVTVGDTVIAIGAPLGLAGTVTTGIISAVDRPVASDEEGETYIEALQTDAAVNPGNSGGPLVDEQGRVIGVNTAIATLGANPGGQSGSIGLGFAIPSDDAETVVNYLIENGEDPQAEIGAELVMQHRQEGALIDDGRGAVESGGPADEAGLEPGDLVVEFDGTAVSDSPELLALISEKRPGDEVSVDYERDGEGDLSTTLTLGSA